MTLDPITSLAQTLVANPGTYAVVLGSGVSTEAGILTGWGIVLDLIGRVAVASGEEVPANPETWWRDRYGSDPDYTEILEQLGGTPAERQAILNGYFEPDEDDRAAGKKTPTDAHRALAALASSGIVKILVTTNFDRLLEQALDEAGVAHRVATNADSLRGLPPIQHAGVIVLKVNGDNRDTRIKNTEAELREYEPEVISVLQRICIEYGLVVCGWSAQWDDGLRSVLQTSLGSHYGTYWAHRGPLSDEAEAVVSARNARTVSISSASMFFEDLATRVFAIVEAAAGERADVAGAVATTKRYVTDPVHRIRLHDYVERQLKRTLQTLDELPISLTSDLNEEQLRSAIEYAERSVDVLAHIMGIGCAWSEGEDARDIWVSVLRRLSQVPDPPGGRYLEVPEKLRRYPALQCLYASGIGALATGRYGTVVALLERGGLVRFQGYEMPLIYAVNESNASSGLERVTPRAAGIAATSYRLHDLTRSRLMDVVSEENRFTELFDRFEYLVGLSVYSASGTGWGSMGAFRRRYHDEALYEGMRGDQSGPHPMQVEQNWRLGESTILFCAQGSSVDLLRGCSKARRTTWSKFAVQRQKTSTQFEDVDRWSAAGLVSIDFSGRTPQSLPCA